MLVDLMQHVGNVVWNVLIQLGSNVEFGQLMWNHEP